MTRFRWLLLCALAALCVTDSVVAKGLTDPAMRERQRALVESALAGLAPQRPGKPDLYVIGVAGDSTADVFRNEVTYLDALMTQRFGTNGRVLTLINHQDSLDGSSHPLATQDNLQAALAGIGKAMDRDEDLLLLFMTMHGTKQHLLFMQMAPLYWTVVDPSRLRSELDNAGIRNRIVVITSCYSGGFIPTLKNENTLIMTAADSRQRSLGCGSDSDATYFGRAWMIEALNETTDFVAAFDTAKTRIAERENAEGFRPSRPQIEIGKKILPRLQAWQSQLVPGPKVAFIVPAPAPAQNATTGQTSKSKDEKPSEAKR